MKHILLVALASLLLLLPGCSCWVVDDELQFGLIEEACHGDLMPCANDTYGIGSPVFWFSDAYIVDLHAGSITGNVTGQEIVSATLVVAASNSVDPDRADYQCSGANDDVEINAALVAGAGGSIALLEGDYASAANVLVPANTVLKGQGMGTAIIWNGAAVTNCIVLNGDYAWLQNMTITVSAGCGAAGSRPNGVYAVGQSGLLLENLCIVGDKTVGSDVSVARQNSIYFANVDNSLIINCTGTNNVYSGARLCIDSNYNTIRNGTYYSNTYNGIDLDDSHYNTLDSINCSSNTEHGLQLKSSDNNNVRSSIFLSNLRNGIYLFGGDSNTISENFFTSNTWNGLYASGLYNRIEFNKAYDNTQDGLYLHGGGAIPFNYNSIIGNTCQNNGDDGLEIPGGVDSNYNLVDGNMLIDNGGTNYVDGGTQTQYWGGSTPVWLELRPDLDFTEITAHGKPTQVIRGIYHGYSLPIYAADNEELFFDVCVPDRWDRESDIALHVDCYIDTANANKNFNLQIDWEHYTPVIDVVPNTFNTVTAETNTGAGAQFQSYHAEFTIDYDIDPGDDIEINDNLAFRLIRIAATANEMAGEPVMLHFAVVFQRNKVGTPIP